MPPPQPECRRWYHVRHAAFSGCMPCAACSICLVAISHAHLKADNCRCSDRRCRHPAPLPPPAPAGSAAGECDRQLIVRLRACAASDTDADSSSDVDGDVDAAIRANDRPDMPTHAHRRTAAVGLPAARYRVVRGRSPPPLAPAPAHTPAWARIGSAAARGSAVERPLRKAAEPAGGSDESGRRILHSHASLIVRARRGPFAPLTGLRQQAAASGPCVRAAWMRRRAIVCVRARTCPCGTAGVDTCTCPMRAIWRTSGSTQSTHESSQRIHRERALPGACARQPWNARVWLAPDGGVLE